MDNWYDRKQYLEEMRLRLRVTWVNGDRKNGLELTEDDCKLIETVRGLGYRLGEPGSFAG